MIHEQPVIDHLDVELATASDVFRLDISPLDGTDLLAADRASAYTWTSIAGPTRSVSIQRGMSKDGVTRRVEVGQAVVELVGALDPTEHPDVRPNARIRVIDSDGRPLFTGRVEDARLDDPKRGQPVTILTAIDAVRDVANTPRYGAANPAAEHETAHARVLRLLASSPVPWSVDARGAITPGEALVEFQPATSEAEALWLHRWLGSGVPLEQPVPPYWFASPARIGGNNLSLPIAAGERVILRMQLVCLFGDGRIRIGGLDFDVPENDELHEVAIEFVAPVDRPQVVWVDPYQFWIAGLRIESPDRVHACNTVHESDLASHLDILANSAGVAWYIDQGGTLRVSPRDPDATPVAHFADDDTGTHGYVGAEVSYDTASLASRVEFVNHARQWDADAGEWRADDQRLGPWVDHTAEASLGQRRVELETTIADVGPLAARPADRARQLLAAHSTAERIVRTLRWNAAEDYDLAHELEVWSLVDVTRRGVTHRMRVVSIAHEITGTRWIITLTLTKETAA